jgi:hypothetical protein
MGTAQNQQQKGSRDARNSRDDKTVLALAGTPIAQYESSEQRKICEKDKIPYFYFDIFHSVAD